MKKTFIYAIVAAVGVTGVAETMPQAQAAETNSARSLDEVRANIRGEAMTALKAGQTETVRHRRWRGGRHYGGRRYYGGGRHYGYRRWRGPRYGYYGYRRPYYGGYRRYGYYRPYYGHRRHYYRRPGVYIGLGF